MAQIIKDGGSEFAVKEFRQHHCLGEIVALIATPPYEHLLECNGQTIDKEVYADLVEVLGSNVLPNLNGRVLQGSSTAGEYKEAGLPNITGWAHGDTFNEGSKANPLYWDADGAIKIGAIGVSSNIASYNGDASYKKCSDFIFDASLSNSIYGASTTVQPPAYTVKYYICWGD